MKILGNSMKRMKNFIRPKRETVKSVENYLKPSLRLYRRENHCDLLKRARNGLNVVVVEKNATYQEASTCRSVGSSSVYLCKQTVESAFEIVIEDLEYTEDSFFVITKDQLEEDLRNAAFECDVEELFQRIISWRKAKGADLFTFEAIDFYDDSEQDDFFATGNTSSFPDENDQTTASAVEAVTHGSTNITIPNTISQVEPSVPASGGLNKITSAVQPRESAPGGLHQTAASSVTAAGGVTSFISAPAFRPGADISTNTPFIVHEIQPSVIASGGLNQTASSTVSAAGGLNQTISSSVTTAGGVTSYISAPAFQPGADISTNTPFIVHEIQPSVIASGGLNQTASSSISTVQPSESASGELHQSASSTVSGGVTSFISAPAFRPGTHGSTNHTIPNAISQVEPRVSASGGLNKITSADQPSVSAPEGLHQTATSTVSAAGGLNQTISSSVTTAGGVTSYISAPAFQPGADISTNTPFIVHEIQPSVIASGGLNQTASSSISTVQPSESASGELHQSASSTVSGGVTSFISAPAFRPGTHGSTNHTIPNAISQVEPRVSASGGLNKITSADQPSVSAPEGLHQTASSSVTAAGGVTSFISAPAFRPETHGSTNITIPNAVFKVEPSVPASGGLNQTASSTVTAAGGVTSYISAPAFQPGAHISTNTPFIVHEIQPSCTVQPSEFASGGLHQSASSTVPASGGVTSFISAPAFRPGTHGSTNHTIPNTISQVEPSVPASGGLNKITSAVQPSVSAPEGLHQTASSSVTAAGGVTSYISAPAFQPGTHSSTNIPFAIYEVQPRVSTSGGVTSFISAPAFQPGNHGNTNIPFTVFEVQPSVSGSGALFGPSALEELLKQTETGKQLIKRAARAPFTKESQRELVDIIAEHHNSQGSKATEENLEQYASAVALLFDKEEKDIYYTKRGGGKRNPGGKIYNRIHNQKQAKKRRDNLEEAHVSQENQAPEGDPVCQEAIEWLRLNVNPWSVTLDKWKSSFGYRRKSLQDPKCARECVDQFRHYSEQYGYQLVGTVCLNDSCDHHYTLNREYRR
ncbi:putative cell agglutination protein pfl5 [Culex quinquefasciatus]|uniref:putative cell agglutination protein pfl5 n=1 Tax=Culex quinquefasciatus TaxID=7176 RepID=UPI0018E3A7BF|nr:putative cell agglutination protein pfl5 [Culex quinquefasciatus]